MTDRLSRRQIVTRYIMRVNTHLGRFILLLLLAFSPIVAPRIWGGSIDTQLTTIEKQQLQREARLIVDLLQNSHYSGRSFREIDNKTMITRFLEELDPQADILSADTVDFIHRRFDRTLKSVYLFRGDLQPAFEIFDIFIGQARPRVEWAQRRLDRGFDFTLDETYEEVSKPQPFKNKDDADRHWELMLKESVLVEQLRGREPSDATTEVKRRYEEFDRTIATFDSLSVRERFFDAIIRSYDPHSGYFSSDSAREFAVEMEKAVVGLGLDLRKEQGHCVVTAVQSGGSADLNSEITPGDVVEALGEGDGPWMPIEKLRLREIVKLMRGAAGTKLRVAYRPGGKDPKTEVMLERTRIVLGSDRARGEVRELRSHDGTSRQIGSIKLPSFYTAGENGAVTSVARDVRELLQAMSTTPLDGLVLDLRGNPGGALSEAAALSELFVPGGMMMLSRGLDGKLKQHSLKEGGPVYGGPLIVLTSANSASASEVFAGAMKFHRRALIVGAASTFGKGTMQNYIDVSMMAGKEANDWGTLRLTMERFYLPDGGSVQRTGIPSDIVLPGLEPIGPDRRESELPGAFAEEVVPPPAENAPAAAAVSNSLVKRMSEIAAADFESLPEWELFREERTLWQYSFSREARSLKLEDRSARWIEHRTALERARRDRRAITQKESYPVRAYEIDAVQSARETHEAKLRSGNADGQPVIGRLRQGSFVIETERGHLRKLRMDEIDFQNYSGDAVVLAAAFSAATGTTASAAAITTFLEELSLLEHKTDIPVLAAARKISAATLTEESTRHGTEALLTRLTELDGEMKRERPGLDVPLRESLRLVSEWAANP